jgi:hypothetical protein
LASAGPLTQKELEAFTTSSRELLEAAEQRNQLATHKAYEHSAKHVTPACIQVLRKLLPAIEDAALQVEAEEAALMRRFALPTAEMPSRWPFVMESRLLRAT